MEPGPESDTTTLTRVLYNNACGDWSFSDEFFSDEFLEAYKTRHGTELHMYYDSYRYDPTVIALFEEFGSKRASHENAQLKLTKFPTEWLDCMDIRVFEGGEHIVFSRDKAYRTLLEEMIAKRVVTDAIVEKYHQIEEVYQKWRM